MPVLPSRVALAGAALLPSRPGPATAALLPSRPGPATAALVARKAALATAALLLRRAALAGAAVVLAGCAGAPPQTAFDTVRQATRERLGHEIAAEPGAATEARVRELLAQPLSADDAVQLALLDNAGLQAALAGLGIAEADRVQAGRWPNPGFSFTRLDRGGAVEIDRRIELGLLAWLTRPAEARIATQRQQQLERETTRQVLQLAARTRGAWVDAVAAEERLGYVRQVEASAGAGAELARRMEAAGNWSALSAAREAAYEADAVLARTRAERERDAARERLVRQLGPSAAARGVRLPERLPPLPEAVRAEPDVEQAAMQQRLDVQAARLAAEQTAAELGLTRATRFVNLLELGVEHDSFSEGSSVQRGYEIRVELPIFDSGDARVQRAEAVYRQAVWRAADTAAAASSQVREAYRAYRSRYDAARHYRDVVVPLRQRIADETLRRYNGMLVGVFELLADARAQIDAVVGAIDARRDYWRADAELDQALVGPPEPRRSDDGGSER